MKPPCQHSAYSRTPPTLTTFLCSVIDVGSEWRTFSSDKNAADPSRVGGAENKLLGSSDLSTMIGDARGAASFTADGQSKYQNRRQVR